MKRFVWWKKYNNVDDDSNGDNVVYKKKTSRKVSTKTSATKVCSFCILCFSRNRRYTPRVNCNYVVFVSFTRCFGSRGAPWESVIFIYLHMCVCVSLALSLCLTLVLLLCRCVYVCACRAVWIRLRLLFFLNIYPIAFARSHTPYGKIQTHRQIHTLCHLFLRFAFRKAKKKNTYGECTHRFLYVHKC